MGILIVDLILDYFIGDEVPNNNVTIMRLNKFYDINPIAIHNLLLYSGKKLDFNNACKLILLLLKTAHSSVMKIKLLKDADNMDNIPIKKRKTYDDSGSQTEF